MVEERNQTIKQSFIGGASTPKKSLITSSDKSQFDNLHSVRKSIRNTPVKRTIIETTMINEINRKKSRMDEKLVAESKLNESPIRKGLDLEKDGKFDEKLHSSVVVSCPLDEKLHSSVVVSCPLDVLECESDTAVTDILIIAEPTVLVNEVRSIVPAIETVTISAECTKIDEQRAIDDEHYPSNVSTIDIESVASIHTLVDRPDSGNQFNLISNPIAPPFLESKPSPLRKDASSKTASLVKPKTMSLGQLIKLDTPQRNTNLDMNLDSVVKQAKVSAKSSVVKNSKRIDIPNDVSPIGLIIREKDNASAIEAQGSFTTPLVKRPLFKSPLRSQSSNLAKKNSIINQESGDNIIITKSSIILIQASELSSLNGKVRSEPMAYPQTAVKKSLNPNTNLRHTSPKSKVRPASFYTSNPKALSFIDSLKISAKSESPALISGSAVKGNSGEEDAIDTPSKIQATIPETISVSLMDAETNDLLVDSTNEASTGKQQSQSDLPFILESISNSATIESVLQSREIISSKAIKRSKKMSTIFETNESLLSASKSISRKVHLATDKTLESRQENEVISPSKATLVVDDDFIHPESDHVSEKVIKSVKLDDDIPNTGRRSKRVAVEKVDDELANKLESVPLVSVELKPVKSKGNKKTPADANAIIHPQSLENIDQVEPKEQIEVIVKESKKRGRKAVKDIIEKVEIPVSEAKAVTKSSVKSKKKAEKADIQDDVLIPAETAIQIQANESSEKPLSKGKSRKVAKEMIKDDVIIPIAETTTQNQDETNVNIVKKNKRSAKAQDKSESNQVEFEVDVPVVEKKTRKNKSSTAEASKDEEIRGSKRLASSMEASTCTDEDLTTEEVKDALVEIVDMPKSKKSKKAKKEGVIVDEVDENAPVLKVRAKRGKVQIDASIVDVDVNPIIEKVKSEITKKEKKTQKVVGVASKPVKELVKEPTVRRSKRGANTEA